MIQAKCKYQHRTRPKVLSSDLAGVDPADVQDWILELEDEHEVGQLHFEHMETCLVNLAESGGSIGGWETFPLGGNCPGPANPWGPREMLEWFRDDSQATAGKSVLHQNGMLHRDARKLYWNGLDPGTNQFTDSAKRLAGLGFMGAIAMGPERFDADAFFAALRAHNTNFLRLWLLDQWSGLATPSPEGLTPFLGSYDPNPDPAYCDNPRNGCYDLEEDNPDFYSHLRKIAQSAADRGIVLQLTLFEKHGLICPGRTSQYGGSPYRDGLNQQSYMSDTIDNCSCGSIGSEGPWEDPLVDCHPLYEFVDDTHDIAAIHERLLRRVGEEVGGIGNAIFEIINEASAAGDWDDPHQGTTWNQYWQKEMVEKVRLSLPLENTSQNKYVVRDAFNGDTDGTPLKTPGLGEASDIQGVAWVPWATSGAQVKVSNTETGGLEPDRRLGYVATESGGPTGMVGTLQFSKPGTWTSFHVRADQECVDGQMRLGTKSESSGGHQVYVSWDCDTDFPFSNVRLYEKTPGKLDWIGSAVVDSLYGAHNVRLRVEDGPSGSSASVFVDAKRKTGPVPLKESAGDLVFGYFWGDFAGAPNPTAAGKVDNFEVAVSCDDAARGCAP